MKSINILSFLLLSTTLSLVPFVAYSRSFTSDNPIVLPTTTHNQINPAVLDVHGVPLKIGEEYFIESPLPEVGGVYWGKIGNHKCPNVVFQRALSFRPEISDGTLVKFVLKAPGDVIRELVAINIMFSRDSSIPCANETVWKVDKVDDKESVVTGGTLGNENNVFKIMKYEEEIEGLENLYQLFYCPPKVMCKYVTVINDGKHRRLVAADNGPEPFVFTKP